MKLRSSQIIANVESGRQKMHTSVKERLPSLLEPLRNKYFAFVRNRIFLHPPFYVNPVFAPFSHLFYATAAFKIANYVIRLSKYIFWENGMILKKILQLYDRRHFTWYQKRIIFIQQEEGRIETDSSDIAEYCVK